MQRLFANISNPTSASLPPTKIQHQSEVSKRIEDSILTGIESKVDFSLEDDSREYNKD